MRLGFFTAVCAFTLSFAACVTDSSTDESQQESGANTDGDNTPDENAPGHNTGENTGCSNTSEVCYCNANADCAQGYVCQIADSPPPPWNGICFPAQTCNAGNCH
jgi:hypothetical protein